MSKFKKDFTPLANKNYCALTFISPACEHCQYQTQALLSDHAQKPEDLRLAFLSDVHPDSLKSYASQFEYDTATTVFLWDEGGKIAQQMEVSSYPTMFLYDTAGVHLQTIVGEAKPSYVYKHFHDTH
ncbi:peroxiredoxin family protein [Neolewinella agarilytica]|uniref:peroxiredoxin family protein n=1 Tax=Neolewinella agarilytica TaxID=478744 RepID=UPI001587086A|nr:redoxin domain-containing protein [Neolewinella agarilytica]